MTDETNPETETSPEAPTVDGEQLEDFDAFWTSRTRKPKRTRIMGQVVELPPSLPLQFELEAQRLQRSKSDKDITKLLSLLFGEDKTTEWAAAGMDIEQFQVLLAWAPQAIGGGKLTLAEVADKIAKTKDRPTKRQKP